MAKTIVVLCDRHLGKGEQVPSKEFRIGIEGVWFTLDLCEDCAAEIRQPVVDLLEEFGAPVEGQAKAAAKRALTGGTGPEKVLGTDKARQGRTPASGERPLQCLWCPLDYQATSGFLRHLRSEHGFENQLEAYGDRCPICGETPTRLGLHVHQHGAQNTPQAFILAREQGDPHGLVAERMTAQLKAATLM